MHWIAIHHRHVFLQRGVHKDDSVLAELIVSRDSTTLLSEPFNLISSYAVSADLTHTTPFSILEEPDSWDFGF